MSQGTHIIITTTLSHLPWVWPTPVFKHSSLPMKQDWAPSVHGSAPEGPLKFPDRKSVWGRCFQGPDSYAVMRRLTGWSGFRPASHSRKDLGFGCARQTGLFQQQKAWDVGPSAPDSMCFLPDCSSPGPCPFGV